MRRRKLHVALAVAGLAVAASAGALELWLRSDKVNQDNFLSICHGGMTPAEVEALLGPSDATGLSRSFDRNINKYLTANESGNPDLDEGVSTYWNPNDWQKPKQDDLAVAKFWHGRQGVIAVEFCKGRSTFMYWWERPSIFRSALNKVRSWLP